MLNVKFFTDTELFGANIKKNALQEQHNIVSTVVPAAHHKNKSVTDHFSTSIEIVLASVAYLVSCYCVGAVQH